jgi:hypothetical protein
MDAAYLDELNRLEPSGEIPFEYLPALVRFGDRNNPTSVALVDPANPAASVGPGVALERAIIEITDDPVTTGIEAKLPWLASSKVSASLFPRRDPRDALRTVRDATNRASSV